MPLFEFAPYYPLAVHRARADLGAARFSGLARPSLRRASRNPSRHWSFRLRGGVMPGAISPVKGRYRVCRHGECSRTSGQFRVNFGAACALLQGMSESMLELDGSFGEGGGQILRSSLALSLLTGRAFHLRNVRAGRPKPGLQPQHLMSVRAAATIGQAQTRGATLHSSDLVF